MLTLIVSRRIYTLVRSSTAHPEKMAQYTQLRWSTIFAENASDLNLKKSKWIKNNSSIVKRNKFLTDDQCKKLQN